MSTYDDKRKIALIGPVPPYRGGIAQYTEQLRTSLENLCDLTVISFSRLYPKALYPGKSDKEETRILNDRVRYIIDSINPLSWFRTVKYIHSRQCDIVFINWWTFFLAPAYAVITWQLRRKGVCVVFLCHNIHDHNSNFITEKISDYLFPMASSYIVHTKIYEKLLVNQYPDKQVLFIPHPVHNNYPSATKVLPKRGELELLFFGFIRPYKGLDILLNAMEIINDRRIYLTIAGESWSNTDELKEKIESINKIIGKRIDFHFEYISNENAANYFERSDIVILPYVTATGSAVANLAYHYGKPVICSKLDGLNDSVIEHETGWMFKPSDHMDLAQLISVIMREQARDMKPAINIFCKKNSWESMAKRLCDFEG